jgi:2-methylisocitrate lyase-like PEP mutase family enzyme
MPGIVSLSDRAEALRALHRPGLPLVLPNAWDVPSARAVEAAGFPAVATTSAGVAEALGHEDGQGIPPGLMLAAVGRIAAAVGVPVTADLEAGYGLEAGDLVAALLETGAVGVNLEDTDHRTGGLSDPVEQAVRLAAVKDAGRAAGVDIVVTARVDVFLRREGGETGLVAEAVERARRYRDAGADCLYPIGATGEATIAALVEGIGAPVNVLVRRGTPSLARLAELGVARASYGAGFAAAARAWAAGVAAGVAQGDDGPLRG